MIKLTLFLSILGLTLKIIASDGVCNQPIVPGPCLALIRRYAFDTKLGKCREFSYGGCKGNDNNFETIEKCQANCSAEKICKQSIETGPCRAAFERYAYDTELGVCRLFTYGGCQGNDNNFETIDDCQATCKIDPCSQPIVSGPCRAAFERYAYDSDLGTCRQFIYGGCQGNDNNFDTIEDCQAACNIDPCSQPIVTGPCRAAFERYAFDSDLGKCRQFTYGGCQGNSNNFETIDECQAACSIDPCSQPIRTGPCKARIIRYGYDSCSGKCKKFVYGGCDANDNNFESLAHCRNQCESC